MTRGPLRLAWMVAILLLIAAGWRVRALPDPYRDGAPLGAVDDRREYRFRDLTYTQTQRLFDRLLQEATHASDPVARGRSLARIASLQRERGLTEAADAAAAEALHTAPNDPEVRRLLSAPLQLGR